MTETKKDTKETKEEKPSVWSWIQGILAALSLLAIVAAVYLYFQLGKEKEAKIKAQNAVAELSVVVEEKDGLYSRLAQQALTQEEMLEFLKEKNEELSDLIENRDERLLALTEAVVRIRATRIIITQETGGIDQTEENGRTRVAFDQTQDPVRVAGFTLTNPAEADFEVSFVRPMHLTTTVVQDESGAWRTYVESDWPGVEVENIETRVDPYPLEVVRRNTLSVSSYVGLNPISPAAQIDLSVLYRLGSWHLGPGLGVFISKEGSGVTFGAAGMYEIF